MDDSLLPPDVDALAHELRARFGQRLRRNEPMAAHIALRVGGPAELWLTATTLDELIEAVALAWQYGVPTLLLGSGANMLVSDQGVTGLVLQNRCQQVKLPSRRPAAGAPRGEPVGEELDPPRVVVESGVILPSLAHRLVKEGLSGLEWAAGVPGTLGGAVVNNAGAYGSCIADCLVRAELYSQPDGGREWQPVSWFEYDYRSSRLKRLGGSRATPDRKQFVVLQAELALRRALPEAVENQMAAHSEWRRATQPPGASIGSIFKNPPDDYAGRLIEAAGLKGTQIGGAEISPVHANFFVNKGDARAADFEALIELARRTVKARFNVELDLEIERIGE